MDEQAYYFSKTTINLMESRHTIPNTNVSIRKVREFLPGLKKMSPVSAYASLKQMPHTAARSLASAIQNAMVNAEHTLKVSKGMLEFRKLSADQGAALKRFRPGSRGTAKPILRRTTHITVVLGVKPGQVKSEKKEEMKASEPAKKTKTLAKEEKVEEKEKKPKTVKTVRKVTKKTN